MCTPAAHNADVLTTTDGDRNRSPKVSPNRVARAGKNGAGSVYDFSKSESGTERSGGEIENGDLELQPFIEK